MINGIGSNVSQLTIQLFYELTSKFQGRTFTPLTQTVKSNRSAEIAKTIVSIALIILFIVTLSIKTFRLSPQPQKPKIGEDDDFFTQFQDSFQNPFPATKRNYPDLSPDFKLPTPTKLPTPKLPPPDVKVIQQFSLDPIPHVATLNLLSDKAQNELKQNYIETYKLTLEIERQLGFAYPHQRSILHRPISNRIHALRVFQNDTQNYEEIAQQFYDHLHFYFSFYCQSNSGNLNLDGIVMGLINKALGDNLSLVFGALCQKNFNEGDYTRCAQFADKILFNSDLKDKIFLALAHHSIRQSQLNEALAYLKQCSYSDEREENILYVAKTFYNQGNLDKALLIAKDMSYSDEREELILNIAKNFYNQRNVDKALLIAKNMSYSDERDEFILIIARYHYRLGQSSLAIKIAQDRGYSKERDELIQRMQQRLTV